MRTLHLSERKVLTLLEQNCRMPASQIAKSAHLSPEGVLRIIKRMEENGVITHYSTKIDYHRMNHRIYTAHIKLVNRNMQTIAHVKRILAKHAECVRVCFSEGEYDLLLSIKLAEASTTMQELMNQLAEFIAEKDISVVTSAFEIAKSFLEHQQMNPTFSVFGDEEPQTLGIDELQLIETMKAHADIGVLKLAAKLHVTPKTLIARMRQMQQRRIITGFKSKINMAALGYQPCTALVVTGEIRPDEYRRLVSYCQHSAHIHYFIRQIGRYDVELTFDVKDVNEFYCCIDDIRNRFPFIKKLSTLIAR
jgi:DNA-binding Lrp family transcriptional regulator